MAEFTQPHNISHPVAADRIKDPNVLAKLADDIKALAVTANNALTTEGSRAEESAYERARWDRGLIPGGVDVREYLKALGQPGQFYVQSVSEGVATQTGLPDDLMSEPKLYTVIASMLNTGITLKLTTFNVWGIDEYTCSSAPVTAGWTNWERTKWAGKEDEVTPGAKYGYKTAALALTTPGSSTETITSLSFRIPFEFSTGFGRFRLHIRNFSDRNNAPYPGVVNFTGLWFGAGNKATGSFNAAPQRLSTGFSTPANADDYVTPWFNAEVKAGSSYLLSAGISASSVTAVQSITAAYRFDGSSSYGATQNITWALSTSLPLDIWIEAEVPAETPIVAELGSSSSVGSKATFPVLESPLSLYCMRVGALPMHYAHSGTTLATWDDQALNKWQKYQECARPDALVLSLGSNDLFGTRTLAEIQESASNIVGIIKAMATDNIYATTIEPRTVGDETKRRQYNSWLKTKPLGIRDVFERAASISNDDETIRPEYDADGIHTNTAGNLAKANAFTRPMFRALLKIQETAGRTVSVWDYLNQREQVIYGDTGLRNMVSELTNVESSGHVQLNRYGNLCTLIFHDVKTTTSGNVAILTLPIGFRPDLSQSGTAAGTTRTQATNNGAFVMVGATAGTIITGSLTWYTPNPWPATLPGVAV